MRFLAKGTTNIYNIALSQTCIPKKLQITNKSTMQKLHFMLGVTEGQAYYFKDGLENATVALHTILKTFTKDIKNFSFYNVCNCSKVYRAKLQDFST